MIEVVRIMSRLDVDQFRLVVHLKRQSLVGMSQMNSRGIRNQTNKLRIVIPIKLHILRITPQPIQKRPNQLLSQLLNLQILRQINEHWPGPTIPRDIKCIVHHKRHLCRTLNLIAPLRYRPHNLHGRCALEGVLRSGRGSLSAQDDHGDTIAHGISDGGDKVGGPGSGGGDDDASGEHAIAWFGGRLGYAFSDVSGAAFVGVGDPSNQLSIPMPRMLMMELI
mmetsp:Transcript_36868/g.66305  ORF Transcript_36868/g.66305 Transcript_36868/m.66305 type:complete len:222 (+) Transcript_36868:1486-2151(+)